MIVAFSMIFIGIKRYRDRELGGVIKFGTAAMLGLGITLVASVIYVVVWEVNLELTDHAFIEEYTESIIAGKEAEGVQGAELEALTAEMAELKERYGNPLFRMPMTFLEIFPVGLLISLLAAGRAAQQPLHAGGGVGSRTTGPATGALHVRTGWVAEGMGYHPSHYRTRRPPHASNPVSVLRARPLVAACRG